MQLGYYIAGTKRLKIEVKKRNGRCGRYVDGWIDRWMDRWMDGWMDGWMRYLR